MSTRTIRSMGATAYPRIGRRARRRPSPFSLAIGTVIIGAVALLRIANSDTSVSPMIQAATVTEVAVARASAPAARSIARTEPPVPFTIHSVGYGETISGIASRAGVSAETIARNNGLATDGILHFGDGVFVPASDGLLYTVLEPAMTSASLAQRLGLQPSDLAAIADDAWGLALGRTVLIPLTAAQLGSMTTPLDPRSRFDEAAVRRVAGSTEQLTLQKGGLSWPATGDVVQLYSPGHTGIDIAAPGGAPIWATSDGVVTFEGWSAYGGIAVCVSDGAHFESCAYHAAATLVDLGAHVRRGEQIAVVGMSGLAAGPHVHWELRRDGVLVNPLAY